ncbi:dipeptidase [Gudongella sp. DL1XJH-153]|uniref:dipeptidase n=1 Tax=Gudongella sp. DL1XJH-153 TaxID=3409804 RepID=UPI003BB5BF20
MKFIDLHCDTLMKTAEANKSISLLENNTTSVDFKRMKKGGSLAQFFAVFLPTEEMFIENVGEIMDDDIYINTLVNTLKREIGENSSMIALAYNYEDILRNEKNGRMSAILTIEDGRSVQGSLDKLKHYYDMGIRLMSLTWNFENCFGYPNSDDKEIMGKGMKKFGKEAVEYMNDLGMIVDVSHISDGGFYDVAKISKKPFVASHSNAREISPHKRNLTDHMIKTLAEKGGVAGINFAPHFLQPDTTTDRSTVELMVRHLNHMKNVGGEDVVALGSDFDGIRGELEVDSIHKMPMIFDALEKDGWSIGQIEKLAYKNTLRVIRESM